MISEVMKLLWPFLKELILGKDVTIGQTVKKREWKRLFMLALVCGSLVGNLYLLPKAILLSSEVVRLKRKAKEAVTQPPPAPPEEEHKVSPSQSATEPHSAPSAPPEQPVVATGPDPGHDRDTSSQERYDSLRSQFLRMQQDQAR